jgi:hypothetical protein
VGDGGTVGDDELVITSGQAAPLPGQGQVAFHDVVTTVCLLVEGRWPPAAGPATGSGGDLVPFLRDYPGGPWRRSSVRITPVA